MKNKRLCCAKPNVRVVLVLLLFALVVPVEMRRNALPIAAVASAVVTSRKSLSVVSAETAYHEAADKFIENLMSSLDALDHERVEDLRFGDSVLSVDTDRGTFVVNKQAPKHQLWLSSPVSGPHHYDAADITAGTIEWRSDRDGHALHTLLSKELTTLLGASVNFNRDGTRSD